MMDKAQKNSTRYNAPSLETFKLQVIRHSCTVQAVLNRNGVMMWQEWVYARAPVSMSLYMPMAFSCTELVLQMPKILCIHDACFLY
jgi:hypothetical protein